MAKSDPIEMALNQLGELRSARDAEAGCEQLRAYLRNRSNLVVAKAAKLVAKLQLSALISDLVTALQRFMANPSKLDKRCAAVTEIVEALYAFDYREPDVYLKGLHPMQKEASFGPPVDTAAALRGMSAQGLVRTGYPDALLEVTSLLLDPEPPARLGAIRALATNGGDAGVLLLRMKVLTGDAEVEVVGECFSALLTAAPEQSLAFVAKYMDDDDDATAEVAIWAVDESRLEAAFEPLREKWERTIEREKRKILLTAMAALRQEQCIAFLRSLVETANVTSASDALAALVIYKGKESITESLASILRDRREASLLKAFQEHFPR